MKKEWRIFILISGLFLLFYFFPLDLIPFKGAVYEALALARWYAREHVLLCLVPAFFIAGAISVFLDQQSVIRYLGPDSNKTLAYGVASISGTILAVCSCTVLPIFSGIYKRGAGIGPATAFLYSGPAINILAIILTARILGWKLGLARAIGAVFFSIIIGLLMHTIFRKSEILRQTGDGVKILDTKEERPLWKNAVYFALMTGVLVFANWGNPGKEISSFFNAIYTVKWLITAGMLLGLVYVLIRWFRKEELGDWSRESWDFAKKILPLLMLGVLISGFLLGRPGYEGLIPPSAIQSLVGGNTLFANFFASVVGAFMYFATLTEVPILEGLIGAGMGQGPALTLLLAGPALSLPSMLVINQIMGTKKTVVYILLVIVLSAFTGMIYGAII